jgi:hypothetical protein
VVDMIQSYGTKTSGADFGGIVIANRLVVFGGTAPAKEKTGHQQPTKQRPTTHRIVVIRNGELVRSKPGH